MRVTMGMTSKQYSKNLNNAYAALNKASSVNTTYRKFDSASEDPVSSTMAYRLRQSLTENESYQYNVNDLKGRLDSQYTSLNSVNTVVSNAYTKYLGAITGSSSESTRATYAKEIRTMQASLVTALNTNYAGNYLFGGASASEAPFSVDENDNLLYRGIDVNSGKIAAGTTATINGAQITLGDTTGTYDGYTIKVASNTTDSVAINDSAKTITVNMNLTNRTNNDLLSVLKTDTHFSSATISGDVDRPIAADTSKATTATIGDAQITLGDSAGAYDNYVIKVANGTEGVNIDSSSSPKTITVSMNLSTKNTAQDLLEVLKTDSHFTGASITGNPSATVSASTSSTLTASNLPSSVAANTVGLKGLQALANEKSYIDIGTGLGFNADGTIKSQSAFDASIPGIVALGYGTADGSGTGMSNNLYTLMSQIATELEKTGTDYSLETTQKYINAFKEQSNLVSSAMTVNGTNTNYLTSTLTNLESIYSNTDDQLDMIANVDTVDAYLDFSQKSYTYNAALSIADNLLQSSVLDYMK